MTTKVPERYPWVFTCPPAEVRARRREILPEFADRFENWHIVPETGKYCCWHVRGVEKDPGKAALKTARKQRNCPHGSPRPHHLLLQIDDDVRPKSAVKVGDGIVVVTPRLPYRPSLPEALAPRLLRIAHAEVYFPRPIPVDREGMRELMRVPEIWPLQGMSGIHGPKIWPWPVLPGTDRAPLELDRFFEYWPALAGSEIEARVFAALSEYDPKSAEVLRWRYRDGLSLAAIGAQCSPPISHQAVDQRIKRFEDGKGRREIARALGPLDLPQFLRAPDALSDEARYEIAKIIGQVHTDEARYGAAMVTRQFRTGEPEVRLPAFPRSVENGLYKVGADTPIIRRMIADRRILRGATRNALVGAMHSKARALSAGHIHPEDDMADLVQDATEALLEKWQQLAGKPDNYLVEVGWNGVTEAARALYTRKKIIEECLFADVEGIGRPAPGSLPSRRQAYDEEREQARNTLAGVNRGR